MNNHLMDNQERFVKWKCPECGNYHKWVWDIYDIIRGEITMTCDNPECGRTSKMFMIVEKGGNATAIVSAFNNTVDNSQVEEKLRRATEKVMNSQTEIDISRVLIEGDIVTIMGVKYQRIIEPQSFYDKLSELLETEIGDDTPCGMITDMVSDLIRENIPEPYENLKFGVSEWFLGYNEALRRVNERLFE